MTLISFSSLLAEYFCIIVVKCLLHVTKGVLHVIENTFQNVKSFLLLSPCK